MTVRGHIEGNDRPEVDLTIEARTRFARAPSCCHGRCRRRASAAALQFNLSGRADVIAHIRRAAGTDVFLNRYTATVRDAALCYEVFPLELNRVNGVLELFPDHWECRDFSARHGDGEIRLRGRSWPLPTPSARTTPGGVARNERVELTLEGNDILMDRQFEDALAAAEPSRTATAGAPARCSIWPGASASPSTSTTCRISRRIST